MENNQLEICPFCGHEATANGLKYITKFDLFSVSCENQKCGVKPYVVGKTFNECINKWNTRTLKIHNPNIEIKK